MRVLPIATILFSLMLPLPAALAFHDTEVPQIEAAIMSAGSRALQVPGIKKVPSVGVLNLRIIHVPGASNIIDINEFRIMAQHRAGGIAKLRSALKANPVTRKALAKHGVNIDRVIGVRISSGGSLRVYLI